MASYPSNVKTFATRTANQTIGSAHVNDLQDEVNAIEDGLVNGLQHGLTLSTGHLTVSTGNVRISTGFLQMGSSNSRVVSMLAGVTPAFGRDAITMANTAAVTLGNVRGMVSVVAEGGGNPEVGLFLSASSGGVTEISDPGGVFSAAQGTATSFNVYWDSTVVATRMENRRGGSRTVSWAVLGATE